MLAKIASNFNLLTCLRFSYVIKPRPSSVPTQSSIMLPYTIGNLHDNPGSRRIPKRLGRGPGSGKGYKIVNIEKNSRKRSQGTKGKIRRRSSY